MFAGAEQQSAKGPAADPEVVMMKSLKTDADYCQQWSFGLKMETEKFHGILGNFTSSAQSLCPVRCNHTIPEEES